MSEEKLGLFNGEDMPDVKSAWDFYNLGLVFNNSINLDDTVKTNSNFVVGKQWEGVQANGLPTPQFNILKRVVGFIVASISTDNIKVNASALASTAGTDSLNEVVRILNEELEALTENNRVPALAREFAYNSAVTGDGCIYTYWDPDVDIGQSIKGAIKSEIIDNTRVMFGDPNDKNVQQQPYIQIASREIVRNVKIRAKANNSPNWTEIRADSDESQATDDAKYTDNKTTVILTMWRNDEDGMIWAYESTQNAEVRAPWSLGIRHYPICWLPWDAVKDSYHGQAMVTGLIPNQIFINKAWAMSMLSIMRTAWPKIVYDQTRVKRWDNRVGGAIGVQGGIDQVAKIMDPATISPQIYQFISLAVEQTQESLGATAVAMGDARPDNTSAILALQKAASTPSEMTKQRLYEAIEDLFRIYVDFIAEYYGTRTVDLPTPPELQQEYELAGQPVPDEIQVEFDFSALKELPMMLKLDVGASTYYSEIASMQTLDQMMQKGWIKRSQYIERIPDGYIPRRRALLNEIRKEEQQQEALAAMQMPPIPPPEAGGEEIPGMGELEQIATAGEEPEIQGGRGYGALQRQINAGVA